MSLNFNLSKVENFEELSQDDDLNNITETLIFCTMFVGIPRITEANALEFYKRVSLYEKLFGSFIYAVDKDGNRIDHKIKLADVERLIGLHTNADPLTEAKFRKRVVDRYYGEVNYKSGS
jgi:hypothetical protein